MVTDIGAPVLIDTGAIVNLAQMRDKDTGAKVEKLGTMRGQITKAPNRSPRYQERSQQKPQRAFMKHRT